MGREEQGGHQQDAGQEQQQVAVALQVAGVADHQQREHVEGHAEGGPGACPCLAVARGRVPPGDDHVADAVEQGGERQDDGVGVRRQPTVRQVGDQRQPEHHAEERPDVVGIFEFCPTWAIT